MSAGVLVLGLGNPLMGDDGAGLAVLEELRGRVAGRPAVRLEDGQTDVLRLASLWRGEAEVWLVDAVSSGAPPGTLHRLDHGEVLALPQRHRHAHRLSVPEGLRWLALAVPELAAVRFRFWGIEVGQLGPGVGLSPAVAAAVVAAARDIAGQLP